MTMEPGSTNSKSFFKKDPRNPIRAKQQVRENTAELKSTTEKRGRSTFDFKENDIASKYIRENFEPNDRLAVVLLNKRSGAVIQRLAPAEKIAAPDFQKWLRYMNDENKYEVYVSMNTLERERPWTDEGRRCRDPSHLSRPRS